MNQCINIRNQATDFFLYAYFGIKIDDAFESIVNKCVMRAYLDMNRTLKVRSDVSGVSFQKEYAKLITKIILNGKTISEIQSECYKLFIENSNVEDKPKAELNDYLETRVLKDTSKRSGNCIYYGQAQKWINMSLKYLWLLGIINDEETKDLDIPIDSIIMFAASEKYGTEFLTDTKSHLKKKYCSTTMPWSKLSSKEYNDIQGGIKKEILDKKPIEWESDIWIEYAEKKKKHDKW